MANHISDDIRAGGPHVLWPTEDDATADADRGFIGTIDPPIIKAADGRVVWRVDDYAFLDGTPPATVNPSLWRVSKLNRRHGLYQVADGIFQVRGFDAANMTIVVGATGFIIIDPLMSVETAEAALALTRSHLGDRPVTAVIISHSHADHFGGIKGVVTADEVASGQIPLVAPAGFWEHAVGESLYAGPAMFRRAGYQAGFSLPRGPHGGVGTGLGAGASMGTMTLIEPTVFIDDVSEMTLDGVPFEFHYTPDTEAKAEMICYLPRHRALCMAEIVSQSMHNIYTLRGTEVRDALGWSRAIDDALASFGDRSDVMFLTHQWPVWGTAKVVQHLELQRDLYRYIHDETLRLANHGYGPLDAAEMIELPDSLAEFSPNRGTYGALNQNVKGVWQRYLGWFDGNPANLHSLPPTAVGQRYVNAIGGPAAVLEQAKTALEGEDLRWAAELLKQLLAADPSHSEGRALQARVFERLGYLSESGVWRNFYLSGARELGEAPARQRAAAGHARDDLLAAISTEKSLDYMAIRLNGPKAHDFVLTIALSITDSGESFTVSVGRGVLTYRRVARPNDCDLSLRIAKLDFAKLASGATTLRDLQAQASLEHQGDLARLETLMSLMDHFN
ncbi:alkyl sulfatase dimerization domain-containing protein [Arthrobacter sp. OV608]|uniref:alkyl/aryl-sulfatase n=1 Tax=Arthrobacter sp. OV608 TaxID=1882768 RepID=UPI0008B2BE88|nr:alkyl sulfatase dimerization domain-containing protein [Arthrobacter sp. OV608]SER28226.1 Alkyl sulfatase BDS1, metallo-beta-lactamase superfamily [Arthrobacter sp. OV608]